MNIWLTRIPTELKVKQTIDKLNDDKALGPDGFMVMIFKVLWNIIKIDLVSKFIHLYLGRNIVRKMNHTFITLIPKVEGLERLEDFRKISCMNSIYKIHADIMAESFVGSCM